MYLDKMTEIKAYFGTDIQGYDKVTDEAWEAFKVDYIDPEFDCYSVETVMGRWQGTDEKTFVLSILVTTGSNEVYLTGHKLAEIIETYKDGFDQECVLVTHTEIKGMFI